MSEDKFRIIDGGLILTDTGQIPDFDISTANLQPGELIFGCYINGSGDLSLFTQNSSGTVSEVGSGGGGGGGSVDQTSQVGYSVSGSREITVSLSSPQTSSGYTTDHINGGLFEISSGVSDPLMLGGVTSKTSSSITFRLSATETVNSGHFHTIFLQL